MWLLSSRRLVRWPRCFFPHRLKYLCQIDQWICAKALMVLSRSFVRYGKKMYFLAIFLCFWVQEEIAPRFFIGIMVALFCITSGKRKAVLKAPPSEMISKLSSLMPPSFVCCLMALILNVCHEKSVGCQKNLSNPIDKMGLI